MVERKDSSSAAKPKRELVMKRVFDAPCRRRVEKRRTT